VPANDGASGPIRLERRDALRGVVAAGKFGAAGKRASQNLVRLDLSPDSASATPQW
jgi:hypothetical protein